MDEYIRNSINARKASITDYYTIPDDVKGEVDGVFARMEELGEEASDVAEFEQKLAASPVNEEYMGLFAKLTVKKEVVAGAMKESLKLRAEDKDLVKEDIESDLKYAAERMSQPIRHEAYEVRKRWARENIPGYSEAEQISNAAGMFRNALGKGKKDE